MVEKETSLFRVNTRLQRGFDSWCNECHTAAGKAYREDNIEKCRIECNQRRKDRIDWLQSFKHKPCLDCGKQYEPFCMDFDHLDSKMLSVTRMVLNNATESKVLEEIAKCELVCALCHNTRTQRRLDEKNPEKKYSKYAQRNIEIINQAKNKPCGVCLKQYEPHNMQLDHIDPLIKFKNISQLKNFKVSILVEELSKCQVLCALCHRRKSIWEQQAKKYSVRISNPKIKPVSDIEKGIKECVRCNEVKLFENFATHNKTKDGYNSWCKDCFNSYRRERRKA